MLEDPIIPGDMMNSIRRNGRSVLGLAHTRLSPFAGELQEEKLRAINLLLWLFVATAIGAGGIIVGIGALSLFLWEWAGYAGLIGLVVASFRIAGIIVRALRRRILNGPGPFAAIVAEFGNDIQGLRRDWAIGPSAGAVGLGFPMVRHRRLVGWLPSAVAAWRHRESFRRS